MENIGDTDMRCMRSMKDAKAIRNAPNMVHIEEVVHKMKPISIENKNRESAIFSYPASKYKRIALTFSENRNYIYKRGILRWKKTGYPRLQRDEIGTSIEFVNVSLLPHLTTILSCEGSAEYCNNMWTYNGLYSLDSMPGYKLKIAEVDSIRLFELGTIIDTLMVHQLLEGQWNWLTYPCYEKAYPWEALAGAIDHIDYIMAEDWSMKRRGDSWIYDGSSRPNIKYGDSIMIQTIRDCSFVWNNPINTPDDSEPQKTTYFLYDDKPDYETIMIEAIEGNPEYTEIGVFQNDQCIGARVFEAYPIQILAYSTPADEGGGELSFLLHTWSKGTIPAVPASGTRTPNGQATSTISPIKYGFRMLTLKTDNQQIPTILTLHSNYPNPFNPSTSISFSIPKTAEVKLDIYNIRGQKVRKLIHSPLEYGRHRLVWNGRDEGNRPVASGVYFARLEHCGDVKIRKMMLLK